jgi:hypothetical protein
MDNEIHPKELIETGLAPEDFELLNGQVTIQGAKEIGFHPDDQYREHKFERHDGK